MAAGNQHAPHPQIDRQRRGARIIGEHLLELAARQDLPSLTWTIGDIGEADVRITGSSYEIPSALRRGRVAAWAGALGIKLRETTEGNRTTILGWDMLQTPFGWAQLVLVSEVYGDDQDEASDNEERNYAIGPPVRDDS